MPTMSYQDNLCKTSKYFIRSSPLSLWAKFLSGKEAVCSFLPNLRLTRAGNRGEEGKGVQERAEVGHLAHCYICSLLSAILFLLSLYQYTAKCKNLSNLSFVSNLNCFRTAPNVLFGTHCLSAKKDKFVFLSIPRCWGKGEESVENIELSDSKK